MQDYASDNTILMADILIEANFARQAGGGVIMGYASFDCQCQSNNQAILDFCIFVNNYANFGGGLFFYGSRTANASTLVYSLTVRNSSWIANSALTGSAVQLVPEAWDTLTDGYLPVPVFEDCVFISNVLRNFAQNAGMSHSIVTGTLFANTFTVNFASRNLFSSNHGTAIYANAGGINALNNSVLVLQYNYGILGGGVALMGFSALRVYSRASVIFVSNYAADSGGAIYSSSTDVTDYLYTRSCFLRYHNISTPPDDWDAHFVFQNNSAGLYGHSIYTDTILPCARGSNTGNSGVFHWKTFHYAGPIRKYDIATAPARVMLGHEGTRQVSPGEVFNVHINSFDDLQNSVSNVYKTAIMGNNSYSAEVDSSYTYVSDGTVRINGVVGTTFNLTFRSLGINPVATFMNVTIAPCPPGYVLYENSSHSECVCSVATTDRRYKGIIECDDFTGLLSQGHWAGYNDDGVFLTGSCPPGYCTAISSALPFIRLNRTPEALDEFLCGSQQRTGLLCGSCLEGHSVMYHSQLFECGICTDSDGKVGWLLYIVSELFPLVVLFVFIMAFNINLTSGKANSFVLFAQVLNFFQVNVFGNYVLPRGVDVLTQIYRFVFGLVNLSFFQFDSLSFCLWKGATVLDVMAFKYVTTAFAILLLLLLVLLLNCCTCNRCCKLSQKDSYVIHGFSAFLVISYAQCAKLSFEILSQFAVMGEGPSPVKSVVFLSGDVEFLSHEHLPYAIPAIFFLLFFCTLPPLVLLIYPAINRIPWKEEWPRIHFGWFNKHCFRLNNLKPLLDSFQGSFKDNYRFFAGVYFLYRLAIAAEYALTSDPITFYVLLEVIIIVMLALHALAQPYKKRIHNLIDALIFADLAIVNAISLCIYAWSGYNENYRSAASVVQLILIYLPLIYIICVLAKRVKGRFANWSLTKRWRSTIKYRQFDDKPQEDDLPPIRTIDYSEKEEQLTSPGEFEYGSVRKKY